MFVRQVENVVGDPHRPGCLVHRTALEAAGSEGDYDTIGGFVVTTLGHIPEAGETIPLEGAVVRVIESGPTRVLRVRFEAKDEAPVAAPLDEDTDETEPNPASTSQ